MLKGRLQISIIQNVSKFDFPELTTPSIFQVDNLPRDPPVPVHILTTFSGNDTASFLENTFDLQRLRYSGKIDNYEFTNLTTNIFDLTSVVSAHKSVEWLVKNCPASTKPSGLIFKSITDYVEDLVGTGFCLNFSTFFLT